MSPRKDFDRFMVDLNIGRHLKLVGLTDSEFRAFVAGILPIAAESPLRGALLVGRVAAGPEHVSERAGGKVTRRVAASAMAKLRAVGLLEHDPEIGSEWVHDFEEWNPEPKRDATAAARAKAYRERLKAGRDGRDANANVTRDSRDANGKITQTEVEEEEKNVTASSTPNVPDTKNVGPTSLSVISR